MGLLFQSNPNRWDLRKHLIPGEHGSWFVSRYQSLMHEGALVLLWESKGSMPDSVKGLYGWGITTGEMKPDAEGRMRIPLRYIERWVSKNDHDTHVPEKDHVAPVAAAQVFALPSWKAHVLAVMPVGTNFLVGARQLLELTESVVDTTFAGSQFRRAVELDVAGKRLEADSFVPYSLVAGR
ncbi:MAG: hypothetical protein JW846_10635 [Dehalococcoidia bacterium]|nr:hypothetical protein [Dehalococcoidia bacterium]